MDQQFLVIIHNELVKLAQCFSYEYREYNYLKDEAGEPIFFIEEKDGIDWINKNVKKSKNFFYKESNRSYLIGESDDSNEIVEVDVALLQYALREIFILHAMSGRITTIDDLTPSQIADMNERIKSGDIPQGYYRLRALLGEE